MKKIKLIAVALIAVIAFSGCQAKDEPATTTKAVTANNSKNNDAVDENEAGEENETNGGQAENSNEYVSETIGIKFAIPDGFSVINDSGQVISLASDDGACTIQFNVNPDSTLTLDEVDVSVIVGSLTAVKYTIEEVPEMITNTFGGENWPCKGVVTQAIFNDEPVTVIGSFIDTGTGTIVLSIIKIADGYNETYTDIVSRFDKTILSV